MATTSSLRKESTTSTRVLDRLSLTMSRKFRLLSSTLRSRLDEMETDLRL